MNVRAAMSSLKREYRFNDDSGTVQSAKAFNIEVYALNIKYEPRAFLSFPFLHLIAYKRTRVF